MTQDSPRRLKSVERTFRIIECLRQQGEMGVTELAAELNASKGTVHTYLDTLVASGHVRRRDGRYRLGLEFVNVGESVRTQDDLFQVGMPIVTELADETGDWAHLIRESNGRQVGLYDARGRGLNAETSYRFLRESPHDLHTSAAGKTIIAFAQPERRDRLLNQQEWGDGSDPLNPTREQLLAELEEVRERGVAFNDQEEMRGIRAVGAPVFYGERVVGAISVSGPRNRLQGERFRQELPDRVLQAAGVIEVALETADENIW